MKRKHAYPLLLIFCFAKALTAQDTTEVDFRRVGLSCHVDCKVNDFPVDFVFDTGAELVSIPQRLATLMEAQGALLPSDYTGEKIDVRSANGSTTKGRAIVFRVIEFGSLQFEQVEGVVMPSDTAGVLLGQTVFSQLSSYVVDNQRRKITLVANTGNGVELPSLNCAELAPVSDTDNSLPAEKYLGLGIKSPMERWTALDYEKALEALERLHNHCPNLLPRKNSAASGPIFAKLSQMPELMSTLAGQAISLESQVEVNNSITDAMSRMFALYGKADSLYGPELYDLYTGLLYQYEELSLLMKRAKGNTQVMPPDVEARLKDDIENGVHSILDVMIMGAIFLGEDKVEEMARKLNLMMPALMKQLARPKFKSSVREQAWVMSELGSSGGLRKEMAKLAASLDTVNEDKDAIKEREALMKLLKMHRYFTIACLWYEGQFRRSESKDGIEFRLSRFSPNVKLELVVDKDNKISIFGKMGRGTSKVYDMTNSFGFDYFDTVDLIVKELVGGN